MVLPHTFRKLMVTQLSTDFRKAVEIVTVKAPSKIPPKSVVIRNRYVGINASDVNFSAGKYTPTVKPPFEVGFEAVGEVVAASDDCKDMIGKTVAHMSGGAFTEYQVTSLNRIFSVPKCDPEILPLLVSGVTAKLAFKMYGRLKPGDKVLVTAAAGGTGQIAVQLAKVAGCHVIGTCSTDEKVNFLKSIGCDHAINVKKEKLHEVLKKSYPDGVDVVYESVGGETYETCVNRLATSGRLIVIGYISGYKEPMGVGKASRSASALPVKLLMKSASVSGFFLLNHPKLWKNAFDEILSLYEEGKLKVFVDKGKYADSDAKLEKLEGLVDAVDYMYSRKSVGKVYVDLFPELTSKY